MRPVRPIADPSKAPPGSPSMPLLAVLAAYLVGAIPTSFLAGRVARGVDLREHGSGNLGAANALRILGWRWALPVVLFDIGKGFLPVWIFSRSVDAPFAWTLAVGSAAVLGHVFSIWVRFRGGKGVATSAGVFLALAPGPTLGAIATWALLIRISRTASVGSLGATIVLPLLILVDPTPRPSSSGARSGASMAPAPRLADRSRVRRFMSRLDPLPPELLRESERILCGPRSERLDRAVAAVGERFGPSLDAVIFYGSMLDQGDSGSGIIDLIVVVNEYRDAYDGGVLAFANRLLPPNWLYLETGEGADRLRVKLSVLSRRDVAAGSSVWFHSYLWARLAQPSRLLWSRDESAKGRIVEAVAQSVLRFHRETLPILSGTHSIDVLWREGLIRTYRSELRPEGRDRAGQLVSRARRDFVALSTAAAPAFPSWAGLTEAGAVESDPPRGEAASARRRWRLRYLVGKPLSALRLAKGAVIFEGAADYAGAKFERHSGRTFTVTPTLRRYPILIAPIGLLLLLTKKRPR